MSNQDEVLAAIKSTKIASVRKATKDQSYTPEALETLYLAALSTGRAPIITHISELGELSAQAQQRGLLTLAKHGHDKAIAARMEHIQDLTSSPA